MPVQSKHGLRGYSTDVTMVVRDASWLLVVISVVIMRLHSATACSLVEATQMLYTDWLVAPNSWSTNQSLTVAPPECVIVTGATLLPPTLQSAFQPNFSSLAVSPVSAGQPLPIYLQNVTFETDCSTVQQYQLWVCGMDTMTLAGVTQISSPYWIYVQSWASDVVVSQAVNITCRPPATPRKATTTLAPGFLPAHPPPCLAAGVSSASGLVAAVNYLQRVQGPPLNQTVPVLIVLEQSITFTTEVVSPFWSYGLPITSNLTIAASAEDIVVDWSNLVNVFNISPLVPGAYLTVSRVVMVNLPVYFAPPASGRSHINGVLQTAVWPINRRITVPQLTLKSCTCVCAYDTFSMWAYFLSVATSPDPSVAKMASWTLLRGIGENSAVGNTLRVANSVSPTVRWINMTLANPDFHPVLVNNVGLLSIAGGIVPPTSMFQVASLAQVQYAINYTIDNVWTAQFGQFIIICKNITGNATNPPVVPPQFNSTTTRPASAAEFVFETVLPPAPPPPPSQFIPLTVSLALPAVLQAVTTFTTWPNASMCWDFQLPKTHLLQHGAQTKVTMRELSLMNLPPDVSASAPGASPHAALVSGFWLFDINLGDSSVMSTYLTLQDVTLYVPPAELQLYLAAASLQRGNGSADVLTASASGKQLMAQWVTRQEVVSSGAHWIMYKSLDTLRFQGHNVNLTDVVPPLCSKFAALPLTGVTYDAYTSSSSSSGSGALPGWAIGVIAGLAGAALLAVVGALLIVRRQRARRNQMRKEQAAADAAKSHLLSSGSDCRLATSPSEASQATRHSGLTNTIASQQQLSEGGAYMDSFSNVFRTTMTGVSQAQQGGTTTSNSNPESIFTQLATRNTGLKDEQLQICGVLGRGGHGVVYKGVWKSLPVAIKVMIVHEEEQEKARRQMLEAMLSTSLSHPNIVTTYTYDLKRLTTVGGLPSCGAGSPPESSSAGNASIKDDFVGATAWQLLIVQELCSGGTMRTLIDRHGLTNAERTTPQTHVPHVAHVLQLALDVAQGMEHLHAKNVVHSDLNPNNVLMQASSTLRPDGLRWTAKVADFGLSEAFEAGRSHVSQRFAGTPFYIAPETQNDGIVSKQSDIFALGILLSEMISGPSSRPVKPPPPPPQEQKQQEQQQDFVDTFPERPGDSPAVTIECDRSSDPTTIAAYAATRDHGASVHNAMSHQRVKDGASSPRGPKLALNNGKSSVIASKGDATGAEMPRVSLRDLEVLQQQQATGDSDTPRASPSLSTPPATCEAVRAASYALPPVVDALTGHPGSVLRAGNSLPSLPIAPDSPRLLGGSGGKFGAARVLPSLPLCCPTDYAALVAECLHPVSHQRPHIGAVVRRLKALAKEHVADYAAGLATEESSGGLFSTTASPLVTLYE